MGKHCESFSNFGFWIHWAYVKLNWIYKQVENRHRCCCCSHLKIRNAKLFVSWFFYSNVADFLFRLLKTMKGYSYYICMRHVFSFEQLIWTEPTAQCINIERFNAEWKKYIIWIVQWLSAKTNLTVRTKSFTPLIFERIVIDSLTWNNKKKKKKNYLNRSIDIEW